MIRTYTLDCHAANPQMPLEPVCPYTGSAATFVLINLPRPHGRQRIDAVTLSITNADAAISAHPATREGSSWIVTVPAAAIGPAGNVKEAIIISASGVDEQNRPIPSWIVAVADLRVKNQDGTAVPGEPRVLISWFDSRPANPRGVFICPAQPPGTGLDLYDGHNYRPLVGGGIDISGKLPLRSLPPYLHELSFDDTYPADAAWLYAQLGPSDLGRCSAVRRGGKLWRNDDWTFDDAAEFVVKMSGNATRFASTGMASVGSRLTENDVMSAVNSRYYKCLPGMTLDGINEKGVVCEINVDGGPKTGWHGDAEDEGIHILAAVRWVLDHGETAERAASWIADHIIQPQGEMNFHFMVADSTKTYIVENGVAHDVTDGTNVLTNYALYDEAHEGGGKERYQLLADGSPITDAWFTNAYRSGNDWDSDFESEAAHLSAIEQWAAQGTDKEAHRGKTTSSGKAWWQSVHTTEYDFAAKTMKVAVQEQDDWYVFAVDQANVDLTPIEARIEALQNGKLDKADVVPASTEASDGAAAEAKTARHVLDEKAYKKTYNNDWTITPDHGLSISEEEILGPPGYPSSWSYILFDPVTVEALQQIGSSTRLETVNFTEYTATRTVSTSEDAAHSLAKRAANPTSGAIVKFDAEKNLIAATPSSHNTPGDFRAPTDNECHENSFTDWKSTTPEIHPTGQPEWKNDEYEHTGFRWIWHYDETDWLGNNDHEAVSSDFQATDGRPTGFSFTATRAKVATTGESFTTHSFVTGLVNGVKTLLGTVASPFSTFAEWIASKFDTSKAVPEFSPTATYEAGEIVLHDGVAYKCTTAITTAEAWTAAHWTEATDADLAARLKGLKSDGTATDQFATDLLGKQVAISAMRYGLASTSANVKAADRTVTKVTLGTTAVTVTFPDADENGKTRDFLLRIDAANLATGGSLAITKPTGAVIYGDAFPSPEATKQYLVAITETAANEFYVRTIEITIPTEA